MTKLHNKRHPAGLERVILKKIPQALLAGFFIPLFMSVFARMFPSGASAADIAKYQLSVDVFSISLAFITFTGALTVTIGCIIVVVMKGPAYVADAYELEDADQPESERKPGTRPQK
jgi:hypothetical protein